MVEATDDLIYGAEEVLSFHGAQWKAFVPPELATVSFDTHIDKARRIDGRIKEIGREKWNAMDAKERAETARRIQKESHLPEAAAPYLPTLDDVRRIAAYAGHIHYRDVPMVTGDSRDDFGTIQGAAFVSCAAHHVPRLMNDLMRWIRSDLPISIRATVARAQMLMIHPFRDGNSRCGRYVANCLLRLLTPHPLRTPWEGEEWVNTLVELERTGDYDAYADWALDKIETHLNL